MMRGDYMLSAVTRAVSGHFRDISVYNELSEQNTPAEFISVMEIEQEQKPLSAGSWLRYCFFDVRYHQDTRNQSRRRIAVVREGLYECLAAIDTDEQRVKATSLRAEYQDGVLHFFADYMLKVRTEPEDIPDMQTLYTTTSTKE